MKDTFSTYSELFIQDQTFFRICSLSYYLPLWLMFVNPLLSPGGLIYFKPIWARLIWEGGLFNLEKTMVSVLHKELEYKVEKLKYKKVGGHAAEDQNQIRTSSW